MSKPSVRVWDLPTRLFHWAIVLLMLASWITIENRWMIAHAVSGSILFALLVFRIAWGFFGSTTSRFGSFLSAPGAALAYLRASLRGEAPHYTGHNPSGGWMVIALIGLLLAQTVTGLMANNDLGFSGPLATLVSKPVSDFLTHQHGNIFYLILIAAWVHVLAVLFYWLVKNDNLIPPMIHGLKREDQLGDHGPLRFASPRRALVAMGLSGLLVGLLYLA